MNNKYIPPKPGRDAFIRRIKETWAHEKLFLLSNFDSLDEPRSMITNLSIPLDLAVKLWNYGQLLSPVESEPSNFAELVAKRLSAKNAKETFLWTDETIGILKSEVSNRAKEPCHRKEIASKLGISVSRLGELIRKERPNMREKNTLRMTSR